ncbi:MAG: molybdopterin-binding protein [Thermomicrobiales bacterium]
MQAFTLDPSDAAARANAVGAIVCEVVKRDGSRVLGKGHVLTASDLPLLEGVQPAIHMVRLAVDDLHEDEAGLRLARALAGDGLTVREPVQSRVNIVANRKGLLRIDSARLNAMNEIFGVAVFSLLDRIPVLPGKNVAGAKITPVAIPRTAIEAAEAIAAGDSVMTVKPYLSRKVGVVTTEGLRGALQARFQQTVRTKLGWFGSEVIGFCDVPDTAGDVAHAIESFVAQGATLILTGGGNTIDPLDATISSLPLLDAELISFGAPAHPGSMFWLAAAGDLPIVNLASCSMYSRSTIADLVLPWIMAGERITKSDMAGLGYGGLLDRDMSFRFPSYASESVDESAAD